MKRSIELFLLTFLIYIGFNGIVDFLYVEDPFRASFFVSDSMTYYSRFNEFIKYPYPPIDNLLDLTNADVVNHGTGFYNLGWIFGRFSFIIGGLSSFLIYKLPGTWCLAMINVIVYNMLRVYHTSRFSINLALVYGLFSYSLIFSATLLRDMQVAFFISYGFYIVSLGFSIKRLFVLVGLMVLTFIFRPTHGLLYILLFIVFLLRDKYPIPKVKIFTRVIPFMIILILSVASFMPEGIFERYSDAADIYSEFNNDRVEESGGAKKIYSVLPAILHPLFRAFQFQINPFSLSNYIKSAFDFHNKNFQGLSIFLVVSDYLWFLVWTLVFLYVASKRVRAGIHVPSHLVLSCFISFFVIILSGFASNDIRRLLGFYPILFVFASIVFVSAPGTLLKSIILFGSLGYFFLAMLALIVL